MADRDLRDFCLNIGEKLALPPELCQATKLIAEAYVDAADPIFLGEKNCFRYVEKELRRLKLAEEVVIGASVVASRMVMQFNRERTPLDEDLAEVEDAISTLGKNEGGDYWRESLGKYRRGRGRNFPSKSEPKTEVESQIIKEPVVKLIRRVGDVKQLEIDQIIKQEFLGLPGRFKIQGRLASDQEIDLLRHFTSLLLQGVPIKESEIIQAGLDPKTVYSKALSLNGMLGRNRSAIRFQER